MQKLIKIQFLSFLFIIFIGCAVAHTQERINKQRIKDIASVLAEHTAGFGKPINKRPAWEELARNRSYEYLIHRAHKLVDQPIPDLTDDLYLEFSKTGNRSHWEKVYYERVSRIKWLVLGECIENKGLFLSAIEKIISAICAERTWVAPAHDKNLENFNGSIIDIDLMASMMSWGLATADYLLGDKLSHRTRQLIRNSINQRIFEPFKDMVTGKRKANWWLESNSNWNAVCLSGVTGSALALIESRQERAFFVAAAELYSKNYIIGFTADGYCSEGVGYWNYGFGHYTLMSEAIRKATNGVVNLLMRKDAYLPAVFGKRIEIINDVYPAFADCRVNAKPDPRLMNFVSRFYGFDFQHDISKDTISASGKLYQVVNYLFPNSATQHSSFHKAFEGNGKRTWFDKAGVLICRPDKESSCQFGVALKGGNNQQFHNHNDVGSYVVAVGKEAILVDPGTEVYTARTFSDNRYDSKVINSYGHPVPIVAGKLQSKGKNARGHVVKVEFSDKFDTLVLDISSAYDVPELKRLERTFIYSRVGSGSLTIKDEVAFTSPQSFGTALITLGQYEELDHNNLAVYGIEEAVHVDINVTGSGFDIQAEEIHEDVKTKTLPIRLGVNLKQPVTTATITMKITPIQQISDSELISRQ